MSELTIHFRGICTHLVRDTRIPGAPKLELTARGRRVLHRVFVAGPPRQGQIHPDRQVPPHYAKLRIRDEDVTADVMERLNPPLVDGWRVIEPNAPGRYDATFEFDGVDELSGPWNPADELEPIPHVWKMTEPAHGRPDPHLDALHDWSLHAQVYVNFYGGVRLVPDKDHDVWATLRLLPNAVPRLVWRVPDGTPIAPPFALKAGTTIEITNYPESGQCAKDDYLLHYFATQTELNRNPPRWPEPKPKAGAYHRDPVWEVYCSNSTYP